MLSGLFDIGTVWEGVYAIAVTVAPYLSAVLGVWIAFILVGWVLEIFHAAKKRG